MDQFTLGTIAGYILELVFIMALAVGWNAAGAWLNRRRKRNKD